MPNVQSVPISSLRGVSPAEASALQGVGIPTTAALLAAAGEPRAERALAKRAGLPADRVREAVNRADLIQVPGIGPATADLFENAGVESTKELALRNPEHLAQAIAERARASQDPR